MITFVSSEDGDWVGLFVDGQLTIEGHSLEPWMVLDILGIEWTEIEADLSPWGRCPKTLGELGG